MARKLYVGNDLIINPDDKLEKVELTQSEYDSLTDKKDNVLYVITDAENPIETINNNIESHKNDINNPHKVTKEQVGLGNVNNTSDKDKPVSDAVKELLDTKVDKIVGKGLSTNDYTSDEKSKLSGIESRAQVNRVDHLILGNSVLMPLGGVISIPAASETSDGYLTKEYAALIDRIGLDIVG